MRRKHKRAKLSLHLSKLGFSNRLAVYIIIFLLVGLLGGFYLAVKSINSCYDGALYCWTIVFTPIGTAVSIVLSKIVDKSKAENTAGGIKYETAMQQSACTQPCEEDKPEYTCEDDTCINNSPRI